MIVNSYHSMRIVPMLIVFLFLRSFLSADEVRVSHCFEHDSVDSISDVREPIDSMDKPHHSFWPNRGTNEWVEYHFENVRTLSSSSVFWFDDTPDGGCGVPKSWKLFYLKPGKKEAESPEDWLPVRNPGTFGVVRDEFNRVTFDRITTNALRIEIQSRTNFSSGLVRWDPRDDAKIDAERDRMKKIKQSLAPGNFYEKRKTVMETLLASITKFREKCAEHPEFAEKILAKSDLLDEYEEKLQNDFTGSDSLKILKWLKEDRIFAEEPQYRFFSIWNPEVRYHGDWYYEMRGEPLVIQGEPKNYSRESQTPGDYISFDFIGTEIALLNKHGIVCQWNAVLGWEANTLFGFAEVLIDGKPLTPENGGCLQANEEGKTLLDTGNNGGRTVLADNLPLAKHSITLRVADVKRPPADKAIIGFRGFETLSRLSDRTEKNFFDSLAVQLFGNIRGKDKFLEDAEFAYTQYQKNGKIDSLFRVYLTAREIDELKSEFDRLNISSPAKLADPETNGLYMSEEMRVYRNEITRLKNEADEIVTEIYANGLRQHAEKLPELRNRLRELCYEKESFFRNGIKTLPPVIYLAQARFHDVDATGNYPTSAAPQAWGCAIRMFEPGRENIPHKTIFEDPNGIIFDMSLSFDAKHIFFSHRSRDRRNGRKVFEVPENERTSWDIYRIDIDGKNLKRLTSDTYLYFSPFELPDGRIGLITSRSIGDVKSHMVCQPGPSLHVAVMDADGGNLTVLSANTLADFTPSVLLDGRILFTRWEYVDADLSYRNALWTINPDGTRMRVFFGNTIPDPAVFYGGREIPGRPNEIVCTFAAHHNVPYGAIGIVSDHYGLEAPRNVGINWITDDIPSMYDRAVRGGYRDPYPIDEHRFLVAYGGGVQPQNDTFRLMLIDDLGNKTELYQDPRSSCSSPIAVVERPKPRMYPNTLNPDCETKTVAGEEVKLGTYFISDIYMGLTPEVQPKQVKSVRVMEQMPKTVGTYEHRSFGQGPLLSIGTYYAKRSWGEYPVEEDGSAAFQAPAGKELYFQAVDADGKVLQTMTTATQLMPGEMQSCTGCHETKEQTPYIASTNTVSKAARRAPSPLKMPDWAEDGIIEYNKLVQPIWDRYCTECHSGPDPDGGLNLSGGRTRFFNMSYDNLTIRSQSNQISTVYYLGDREETPLVYYNDMFTGIFYPRKPLETWSRTSRLVNDYIDTDHCGKQIPAEIRKRIYLWIDALVPYYDTSDNARPHSRGGRDAWGKENSRDLADWYTKGIVPIYEKRCNDCHGPMHRFEKEWTGKFSWIDMDEPENSPMLSAHLLKSEGGREITTDAFPNTLNKKWLDWKPHFESRWEANQDHYRRMESALRDGKKIEMFQSKNDPDYIKLLEAIREGSKEFHANPRADMDGFVPKSDFQNFHKVEGTK